MVSIRPYLLLNFVGLHNDAVLEGLHRKAEVSNTFPEAFKKNKDEAINDILITGTHSVSYFSEEFCQ